MPTIVESERHGGRLGKISIRNGGDTLKTLLRTTLSPVGEFLQARRLPYRGVYATFEDAAAAVRSGKRVGYDHAEAAELYLHDVRKMRTSDYPVIYWLEKRWRSGSRVFDWGGNLGHSYYTYQEYLRYPENLTWTICDVPEITRAGQRLAERSGATALSFTNEPESCEGCDVMLISGALQYIPRSLESLLRAIRVKPRTLFINRTPVHPERSFFTLQNIGPVVCPYQVFAEPALIAMLKSAGYTLRDRWTCHGTTLRIPFHPRYSVETYSGFYFERNES